MSFATIPVPLVVGLLLVGAALGVLNALITMRRPIWVLPPALAGLCAVGVVLTALTVQPVPEGAPIQNIGAGGDFAKRYDQARILYGEPIGSCGFEQGFLSCWTRYARMQFHPNATNPYYRIQNANLGDRLLELRYLQRAPEPVIPTNVATWLAAEAARGVDTLYWIGPPLTNPESHDGRTTQVFQKAALSWPTGSTDPAEIRREPLGAIVWSIEHGRGDPEYPDPWPPLRLGLLGTAMLALLVSAAPILLPQVFRRRYAGFGGLDA
jgi:hypothetical protein